MLVLHDCERNKTGPKKAWITKGRCTLGIYLNDARGSDFSPRKGKAKWLMKYFSAIPFYPISDIGQVPIGSVAVVMVENNHFDGAMVIASNYDLQRVLRDDTNRPTQWLLMTKQQVIALAEPRYHRDILNLP